MRKAFTAAWTSCESRKKILGRKFILLTFLITKQDTAKEDINAADTFYVSSSTY
jgi:hypothetical protein